MASKCQQKSQIHYKNHDYAKKMAKRVEKSTILKRVEFKMKKRRRQRKRERESRNGENRDF